MSRTSFLQSCEVLLVPFLQKMKLRPREIMELSSDYTVSGGVRNPIQTTLTLKRGPILFLFAAQENSGLAQEEISTVNAVILLLSGSYLQDLACVTVKFPPEK